MNILKLAVAFAVAITGLALPSAPASAQPRDQYERHDRSARDDNGRHRGWERGRHRGWERGRHRGWRNNQRRVRVCRTVWRHHHRQRVCTWRYRRR